MRWVLWVSALVSLVACADAEAPASRLGERHAGGVGEARVIARVDACEITVGSVRTYARSLGTSAREALTRLEDECVLASEAARRGYSADLALWERAAVQAWLVDHVESLVLPEDPAREAALEALGQELSVPERRSGQHWLIYHAAQDPEGAQGVDDAARRALAEEALSAALAGAPLEEIHLETAASILVEALPPVAMADLDEGFAAPFFAASPEALPRVLPQVIESSFGFHLVRLEAILPAHMPSRSELEEALDMRRRAQLRRMRLNELLSDARARAHLVLNQPFIDQALHRGLAQAP